MTSPALGCLRNVPYVHEVHACTSRQNGGSSYGFTTCQSGTFRYLFSYLSNNIISGAMSKASLHTYLRTHRKRAGLSQKEVAALIDAVSSTTVSRHEAARRGLSLPHAFAYEALFGVPASALFPGEYERARSLIEERAIRLIGELVRLGDESSATRHKRLFLEGLVRRVRN